MKKYEVNAKEYFEKLREDETPKELGYFFEDFEKPMNQLIERYDIKNKRVLSIGGLFGHEEYYFSINGCNITIVDKNIYATKHLEVLKPSENPTLTYIVGDIQEVIKKGNKFDVIYLSGLPEELQWNDNGFSELILECINTFLDEGLFICQTYHGGLAMNYPTSITLLEEQCKREDLFLESLYYFELYPAISLVILYKGEREGLDINKDSQITQFHGRSKEETTIETIYQLGVKSEREKNIIIVSMERSGSNWVAAIISEVYQAITGNLIKWNHEISRVWAIDDKYELPQGWNSVYDVKPSELLKRGYDKIIVLERNLETLKRVYWTSQRLIHGDLSYEIGIKDKRYSWFFKTIEDYWNEGYNDPIVDERIIRVDLDDLNNYTFNTFNELFDFLEFPKNRPILIPVNPPERNWQCFSDLLAKGHRPSDSLKSIELKYALNITEAQLQLKNIENKIFDENTANYTDPLYMYAHKVNPYKMAPEEVSGQANGSFRILIDSMVDIIRVMKTSTCELCKKEFKEKEYKHILPEWYVSQNNSTIIKRYTTCKECYDKNKPKIIKRDWQEMEERVLDLGCGTDKKEGAYGVDHIEFPSVDYICDLNEIPWVFGGGGQSWDVIYMTDILEHLEKPIDILREVHRILKIGGTLIITVVYWNHKYSFSNLTHKHALSEISFNCLIGKGRPLGLDFQFSSMDIEYIYDSEAKAKYKTEELLQEKAFRKCNIIQGMIIKLKK